MNPSQLFIYVFCETPLAFGDLSQTAAQHHQSLILEVKCIIAQHSERKRARPCLRGWSEHHSGLCPRRLKTQNVIYRHTVSALEIKSASRSVGHLYIWHEHKHNLEISICKGIICAWLSQNEWHKKTLHKNLSKLSNPYLEFILDMLQRFG